MNTIDVNQVLTQMRRLEGLAKNEATSVEQGQGAGFSDLLKQSIDKVNETQQTAGELKTAFETGSRDVDLAEVMIAVQKSSVSFQAMVQVRNKLVEAYKSVMSMPV
ncbi:MAG: flagellar hook-basal body complex protein FliE [Candidatus Polarisedimenticolaceae bacterium]|nr:flagellar hook-basal body complex protein FliE [Candidatus Polarisedimenticolaceae bacterium]